MPAGSGSFSRSGSSHRSFSSGSSHRSHGHHHHHHHHSSSGFSTGIIIGSGSASSCDCSRRTWCILLATLVVIGGLIVLFVFAPWDNSQSETFGELESKLLTPDTTWNSQVKIEVKSLSNSSLSALQVVQTAKKPSKSNIEKTYGSSFNVRPNQFVYESWHLNKGSTVALTSVFSSTVEFYLIKGKKNFNAFQEGEANVWLDFRIASSLTLTVPIRADELYYFVWGNTLSNMPSIGTASYIFDASVYLVDNTTKVVKTCTTYPCTLSLEQGSAQCVVINTNEYAQNIALEITTSGRLGFYFAIFLGGVGGGLLLLVICLYLIYRFALRDNDTYENI